MHLAPSIRLAIAIFVFAPLAHAAEHITLASGFEIDCVRHEQAGDKIRVYPSASAENYYEVPAASVVKVEVLPDPPSPPAPPVQLAAPQPSHGDLTQLLAHAGVQHNIDAELLASVVHAESNGQPHAVSRTGARGLMQLMPGTAAALGVTDAFIPAQNVEGGTAYLDSLLTRYHDDIALALAAYNAGPGAVDRYHGIPPFRETRAYVARVIREFNRRKSALLAQAKPKSTLQASAQ
jgi:soluble lytic murein transglycosylase-like protein